MFSLSLVGWLLKIQEFDNNQVTTEIRTSNNEDTDSRRPGPDSNEDSNVHTQDLVFVPYLHCRQIFETATGRWGPPCWDEVSQNNAFLFFIRNFCTDLFALLSISSLSRKSAVCWNHQPCWNRGELLGGARARLFCKGWRHLVQSEMQNGVRGTRHASLPTKFLAFWSTTTLIERQIVISNHSRRIALSPHFAGGCTILNRDAVNVWKRPSCSCCFSCEGVGGNDVA